MTKTWIVLGALIAALLGASPAQAGIAIDNTVMLDPYDPVPPIQFSHWYGGGCEGECGQHCWHDCYRHASCGEGCSRHADCDERCGNRCERDCDRHADCDEHCGERCEHDCDRHCGDRGCHNDNDDHSQTQAKALPCTTGDCYESERWEHNWRDGDHESKEWLDRGRKEGARDDYDGNSYDNGDSYDRDDDHYDNRN